MLLTSSFVIATGLSSLDPRTPRSPPKKRVMDNKIFRYPPLAKKKPTHMKHLDTTAEKNPPLPLFLLSCRSCLHVFMLPHSSVSLFGGVLYLGGKGKVGGF